MSGEEDGIKKVVGDVVANLPSSKDGNITLTFLAPPVGGQLIGKEGANVQKIQDATSAAAITISKTFTGECTVKVVGTADALAEVASWLLAEQSEHVEMAKEWLSTEYDGNLIRGLAEATSILLLLDGKKTGLLLGKGGQTIQKLGRDYHCSIDIDKQAKGPNGENIVKLTGAMGDVHELHRYISRLQPHPVDKSKAKAKSRTTLDGDPF